MKDHERLLQATTCQQNGQSGRNGQILRKAQRSMTERRRNRKYKETKSQALKLKLFLKIFQQTKAQDQMASQANSIKHLEKS